MWKKIIGYILIIISVLIIVAGISSRFYKTPYCERVIANYEQSPASYEYEYIEEFKNPSGSCYNHFTALKLVSNLIVFGFGVYLIGEPKKKII